VLALISAVTKLLANGTRSRVTLRCGSTGPSQQAPPLASEEKLQALRDSESSTHAGTGSSEGGGSCYVIFQAARAEPSGTPARCRT
jgi:hypothetical protein